MHMQMRQLATPCNLHSFSCGFQNQQMRLQYYVLYTPHYNPHIISPLFAAIVVWTRLMYV